MEIKVTFHSYFRELAGRTETTETVVPGSCLGDLLHDLRLKFPKLKTMERSTLVAVGVEYQPPDYKLQTGDEVSLFPPVQGG